MKFIAGVILIAAFSAIAEYFLPWWSAAVVAFLISLLMGLRPGRSFAMGFLGIALLWLVFALWHDTANQHILSTRMGGLFHLPAYGFMAVTILVGALIGGLSALSASFFRVMSQFKKNIF